MLSEEMRIGDAVDLVSTAGDVVSEEGSFLTTARPYFSSEWRLDVGSGVG